MFYAREFNEENESFVSVNRFIQPKKEKVLNLNSEEQKASQNKSNQKKVEPENTTLIKDVKTEKFTLNFDELNEYVRTILKETEILSKQNEIFTLINAELAFDILDIPSFGLTNLIGLVKKLDEKSILLTVMNIYPLILSAMEKTDLPMSKFKQEIWFQIIYKSYKEGHHITGGNMIKVYEYLQSGGSPAQAPLDLRLTWIPKNDMLLRVIHKDDVVGEMKMFEGMAGSDLPGLEYLREHEQEE